MTRSPVSLSLIIAVLRTTRLAALLVTSTLSVAFLAVPLLVGLGDSLHDFDVSALYHLSLIVSLAGAGFVLDDPAHQTLAVTVVGRAQVAVLRMIAGLCVLAPVWAIQLLLAPQLIITVTQFPVGGLAIEGPILVICIWAVSIWSLNRLNGHASSVAVPAALIGCAAIFFLPEPIALFVNPAAPAFSASRVRFALLGMLALTALAQGLRLNKVRIRKPTERETSAAAPQPQPRPLFNQCDD